MVWFRIGALFIFCAVSVFAGWWAVTPNLMFCALALLAFSGPYDLTKLRSAPMQPLPPSQAFGAPLTTGSKWNKRNDIFIRGWLLVGSVGVIVFLIVVKTNRTERFYEAGLALLLGILVSLTQWRISKRITAPTSGS